MVTNANRKLYIRKAFLLVDFACQVVTLKTCAIVNPIILGFQEHPVYMIKPQIFPKTSNTSNTGKPSFSPSSSKALMVPLLALINDFHQDCFDFPLNRPV